MYSYKFQQIEGGKNHIIGNLECVTKNNNTKMQSVQLQNATDTQEKGIHEKY